MSTAKLAGAENLAKGFIINRANGTKLTFGFNPESVSTKNSAVWVTHKISGVHDPRLQYGGGEGTSIDFELHLIHSGASPYGSSNDVDEDIRWLESLVFPDVRASSIANREPPRVTVLLSSQRGAMNCVVTSVGVEQRLFFADLRTRYAIVSLSLIADHVVPRGYTDHWTKG